MENNLQPNIAQLINASNFQESIDLKEFDKSSLLNFLKKMSYIRSVERQLANGRKDGVIGGPVHLGVGQEAIPVGISHSLTSTDIVFGAHRSHAHLLSLNLDAFKLFSEVLGKKTGFSKGMGGSMHLWDGDSGFYGSVPIVAGTVSLALGAALACKLKNDNNIAVAYFGDGAVEEGVVHEALNLAKILNLPILFVCENNLFASHMYISQRQSAASVARFATANNIPFTVVDGNDVVAVADSASKVVSNMRKNGGAYFIELITYRWFGHVDWREDIDVGVNRSQEDLNEWRKRDPIKRLEDSLIACALSTPSDIESIHNKVKNDITRAWDMALAEPSLTENDLGLNLYK